MKTFTHVGKSGFTLIELLVVVTIIGILASIAYPSYRRTVERARSGEALTIMRAVYDACERLAWEKGYDGYDEGDEIGSCKKAVIDGKVTFKNLDVLVTGKFDGNLSLQTDNFTYTLNNSETDDAVITASPSGIYEGALISFNGHDFDCTDGEVGTPAEEACKGWGAAGWKEE